MSSPSLPDAVICSPVRIPVGRYGGMYRDVPVADLASAVVRGLVERTGLASGDVDDVLFGQGYANGEAAAIGRVAALDAGLDVDVPGLQLDRRCGSGLQAVAYAAMQVQTGVSDLVLAGGAESMSQAEFYAPALRWGVKRDGVNLVDRLSRPRVSSGGRRFPVEGGMIETAENLRREYAIPREEQDAYAVRSHQRAVAAMEAGHFDAETVPMTLPATRKAPETVVTRDEHPRPDASMDSMARLRPIRAKADPEATVTAGNASGQNDGASVCIVTTPAEAERLGLRPMARMLGWAATGVDPRRMGIGPVSASAKVLDRLGLGLGDMDLIELNEAFAAQVLACTREWGLDAETDDRFNVNGSGIALGHPIGATGGRILANLLHEMERREVRYGLETMCIGGGQGIAAVFERWVG
ncbi:acetyl-CoA acetyltransferase [Marmoricola endophyticus]|uniref:Probable acetyl-CoA acetyltransferase n=1 Tax=Marmoricola endophyticus TaxID=2040280 RepID=A0A917F360_9ACTN|nr:acetyl-CoA C-acetyltransferase [Marmoricola endophyticus]GGF48229.1 acetyl-CoA acetyltransferase [Marmoricola endophyticus]